jgi:hypothetical protein
MLGYLRTLFPLLMRLGRPGRRWDYSTKMYFKEIALEDVNWICVAQNKGRRCTRMDMIVQFGVQYKTMNFLAS